MISHRGGSAQSLARSGDYLYVIYGDVLYVYDVADVNNPVLHGSVVIPGGDVVEISANGTHVYVAARLGLIVINANDPDDPRVASTFAPNADPHISDLANEGSIVYLADNFQASRPVYVVDASAPANPTLTDTYSASASLRDLAADGGILCVATASGIEIVETGNPNNVFSNHSVPTETLSVAIANGIMCRNTYLNTSIWSDLDVYTVAVGSAPVFKSTQEINFRAEHLALGPNGNAMYLGTHDRTEIYDVSNPNSQIYQATIAGESVDLHANASTLFLAHEEAGIAAWNVNNLATPSLRWDRVRQPARPVAFDADETRMVVIDDSQLEIYDVSVAGDPTVLDRMPLPEPGVAVCLLGNLAFVGGEAGTISIVDIEAVGGAAIVGSTAVAGVPKALGAAGGLLCVLTDAFVLRVFDVSNPALPQARGSIANLDGPGASPSTWDVLFDGDSVWASHNNGSWRISLANPESPAIEGEVLDGGEIALSGGVLVIADGFSLEIHDVSDISNPQQLWSDSTGSPDDVVADGTLICVADDDGRVVIYDTASPAAPVELFVMNTDTYSGPKLAMANGRLWRMSTFSLSSGIFEISIPEYPRFDLRPEPDTVCAGGIAQFRAEASAGSPTFRWYWNGIPMSNGVTAHGSIVAGAFSQVLTIFNVSPLDGGNIRCVATNACGIANAGPVLLTISGCPGDTDCSGFIDLSDLSLLLSNFGTSGASREQGDFDGDGIVSISDLAILLSVFGTPCA